MTDIQRISSPADVDAFVVYATTYPHLAVRVKELIVNLDQPFSLHAFRHCLSLTPSITDLYLHISTDVPADVLGGIDFKDLEFLKTNLPHQYLLPFLAIHVGTVELSLGPCGRAMEESCPLRLLDTRSYASIECPSECLLGVTHPSLVRLALQESHRHQSYAPPAFRSLPTPLLSLSCLTLDFLPDDYDILENVVRIAPRIQKLKLLEKPRVQRRQTQLRRVWIDATAWARTLARLSSLEDFALKTAGPIGSSVASEKAILTSWVTSMSRTTRSANAAYQHPTLISLRVWYRCWDAHHEILTLWSRAIGTWRNIYRLVDPPTAALF